MALKNRITQAELDGLSDEIKPHYKAEPGKADSWVLDTDGSTTLKNLHATERNARRQLSKMLAALVPGIEPRDLVDTAELRSWQEKVDALAATARELTEAGWDPEGWLLDRDGDPAPKPKDKTPPAGVTLAELQAKVRVLEREKVKWSEEKTRLTTQLGEATAEAQRLLVGTKLDGVFAGLDFTSPALAAGARAMIQQRGIFAKDGEAFTKDDEGNEVPLAEYVGTWKETPVAKEYLKAPDNSGGGGKDGKKAPLATGKTTTITTGKPGDWQEMSPTQMLEFGLAEARK